MIPDMWIALPSASRSMRPIEWIHAFDPGVAMRYSRSHRSPDSNASTSAAVVASRSRGSMAARASSNCGWASRGRPMTSLASRDHHRRPAVMS